jgi:lysozyme
MSDTPVIRTTSRSPIAAWLIIAVTLIAGFEGFYSRVYRDSVGVPTICYGATAADHVDLNRTYTKPQCQTMLASDIPKYDAQAQKCLTSKAYSAMPPYRHAAIVSFVYNVGEGAFCNSSVARDLNNGNITGACNALLLYNRGGGRVIAGLTNRRHAERVLCLRGD